jgi:hypothetical protein
MNIDPETLDNDIASGTLRQTLEEELIVGFRQIQQAGERLPVASHYAAQIAEIINRDAELSDAQRYELYQEVLDAVTNARAAVLGDVPAEN